MGFDLSGETKGKLCACGCGEKAEFVMEIGKLGIPMTNDCIHKMVLELFSLCETINKNPLKTELGSFKGDYGVLTDYGIDEDDESHSLIFFNKEKNKGVRIEWSDLYSFVQRTEINK